MQTGSGNEKCSCLHKLFIHILTNLCGLTAITHYLSVENVRLQLHVGGHLCRAAECASAVSIFLQKASAANVLVCLRLSLSREDFFFCLVSKKGRIISIVKASYHTHWCLIWLLQLLLSQHRLNAIFTGHRLSFLTDQLCDQPPIF